MQRICRSGRKARRGNALLMSLVSIVAITGIAGAILGTSLSTKKEVAQSLSHTDALYVAEAGVSAALNTLTARRTPSLGTANAPTTFGHGAYWGTAVSPDGNNWTITSIGRSGSEQRAVQAVITRSGSDIYDNAIYAGNSSGDPTYTMAFGGRGSSADAVNGDMYSGGSIRFSEDAKVDGTPRAYRDYNGPAGAILPDDDGHARSAETGATQPLPDLAAMNYAVTADVNVSSSFASATYSSSGNQGGSAYILPKSNVAHIFRKHPSDRRANWTATEKEDYFLEDPYQSLRGDSDSDGRDCNPVQLNDPSLSGYGTQSGNNLVYYIDGNLWIHNSSTMSFKLKHPDRDGLKVTFVVKGNIYISDNIFYNDTAKDGIAFITLKDSAVGDSGNIYFGDPSFGTLNRMDSYMYAENNFVDNNLDALGSMKIVVNGNMTAGNQVAINRDSLLGHTKMTVNQDPRVASGALSMPGLPRRTSGGGVSYTLVMLREIPVP